MPPLPESPAAERLARLERFLAQDPGNPHLLAETWEAALAAGERAAAQRCIATAERLQLDAVPWAWRRALAALFAGDAARARAEAAALLSKVSDVATLGHVQALWLRACHHLGALDDAWAWTMQQRQDGRLQPLAAGVAALVAVDLERLAEAKELADLALAAADAPPEAQVARAYAALADDDAALAAQLLEHALARHPDDGRTWSALGMVSLRNGAFVQARERLEQATRRIPGHIGSWHALGWTCLLQQDLPGARQAFTQALALDRNFAESHAAMALVDTALGQHEDAEQSLARAERLDRNGATARYVRALRAGALRGDADVRAFAARLLRGSRVPPGRLRARIESPDP